MDAISQQKEANEAWERHLSELGEFREQYGHTRVLTTHPRCRRLGTWVIEVRCDRRAGKLSPDRIASLDRLGFVWDPDAADWQEHFQQLLRFRTIYGHPNVWDGYWDKPLAAVVRNLRSQYRKGKLAPARIQALEEIGFSWVGWARSASKGGIAKRVAEARGRGLGQRKRMIAESGAGETPG